MCYLRTAVVALGIFCLSRTLLADPDQSTPLATEKSFWSAIDQADADGAKKLCKYDENQGKWLESFAAMCDGFRKLHDSAAMRFGDYKPFADHTPGYYAAQELDKCTVRIDGDTATIVPPGMKVKGTKLVREDGKWIVDLKSSMAGDLSASTATYQAVASSARDVARNMDDGKYASALEASTDFKARLKKATQGSAPANSK